MSSPADPAAAFPGLKRLLLPRRSDPAAADVAAMRARALFQPPDTTVSGRRRTLVEFLGQVGLFEDLGGRDLARLARIVHELRRTRPAVVLTFGPDGAYGHPDHIAISQLTTTAVAVAADPSFPSGDGDHPHRVGGTHRGYWDYENGGMGDMGQHFFDPVTWTLGNSNVDVNFTSKGPGKSTVQVEHSKLSDAEAVAVQKAYWDAGLERLGAWLAAARPQ